MTLATSGGAREARRRGRLTRRSSLFGSSLEMTCTSMAPDARTTRLITEPRVSSRHRDGGWRPSTSCVAFSARANSTSALADVVADDLVVLAAELVEQLAVLVEQLARRRRRARRSAGRARRAGRRASACAMRAARRIRCSPPGAPVIATTTRSRVSHGPVMPWRSM